ncbi:MAG: DMT family transporter, partial [Patescibacteria group bacterium]
MAWYFYALFAAIGITIVGVLQKKTLKQEHSLEYVALLNMAKLIVFLLLFSQVLDLRITSVQFVVLGISGFVGACALLFTARAMRAMELSSVLPILALDPAIVAVLAFFLLGEGLSINKIMGLGMTLVGTFVLEFHNANHEHLAELFRRPKHLLVPFRNFGRGPGGRSLLIAVSALAMGG